MDFVHLLQDPHDAVGSREVESSDPSWKQVAVERYKSSGFSELKDFMFEQFFEQHEDSVHSMELPFPDLPPLYATENVPIEQTVIHMHLFLRNSHWYVAEYSPEKEIFFGYTILNGDTQMAVWGYISLEELKSIDLHGVKVERDLSWEPKAFSEIGR